MTELERSPNVIETWVRTGFSGPGAVRIATANTGRDGTGTIAEVCDGGPAGGRIDVVRAKALETTTAGMIRFWLWDGGKWLLVGELLVTAVTASGTVASFEDNWEPGGGFLSLGPRQKFGASTNNGEAFSIMPEGGLY